MLSQGQECVLFKASSGDLTALVRHADGSARLLHSAVDPAAEAAQIPLPEIWGDVVLCLGTGLGYHLREIPAKSGKARIVILCDLWPDLVDHATRLIASSHYTVVPVPLMDQSRTTGAFGRIRRILDTLPAPRIQIIRHPASYRINRHALEEFSAALFQDFLGVRATTAEGPAGFSLSAHGKIVAAERSSRPQRVLLLYGTHFLQKEIRHALEQAGHNLRLLDYAENSSPALWESRVLKVLQDFFPDIILSVNLKGIDTEGILVDSAARLGIPVHAWFVDDPRPIALAYPSRIFPHIRAYCWERAYLNWLMRAGFAAPTWLPLAGDPFLFSDAGKPEHSDLDLVFTGSAMASSYLNQIRRSFLWNRDLEQEAQHRASALLQALLRNPHPDHQEPFPVLKDWDLPFKDERNRSWLSALVHHSASHLKRKAFLAPLIPEGLICAGDPQGWKETFGEHLRTLPDINYRTELCAHYQRGKIHINITSCQMPSAVNQRVFDIPLSGAFVLSDSQTDMQDLFGAGVFPVFTTPEELLDQVRFYSRSDSAREKIIRDTRRIVLAEHTYGHRIRHLLRK